MYELLDSLTWHAKEVSMSEDLAGWRSLDPSVRAYFDFVFGMFGAADEKINKNLNTNFIAEIEWLEITYFLTAQASQEQVHSVSYSNIIETLYPEREEQQRMFNATLNMKSVKAMMEWADKYTYSDTSLGQRLIVFALFEGLLFSSQFLAIEKLRKLNVMPGVVRYNEFISRDEELHCDFGCMLVQEYLLPEELASADQVLTIAQEAVALCDQFQEEAFGAAGDPTALHSLDLSLDKLKAYQRYIAGDVLEKCGYDNPYNVENPYPDVRKMGLNQTKKVNFFEGRSSGYQKDVDLEHSVDLGELEADKDKFQRVMSASTS